MKFTKFNLIHFYGSFGSGHQLDLFWFCSFKIYLLYFNVIMGFFLGLLVLLGAGLQMRPVNLCMTFVISLWFYFILIFALGMILSIAGRVGIGVLISYL